MTISDSNEGTMDGSGAMMYIGRSPPIQRKLQDKGKGGLSELSAVDADSTNKKCDVKDIVQSDEAIKIADVVTIDEGSSTAAILQDKEGTKNAELLRTNEPLAERTRMSLQRKLEESKGGRDQIDGCIIIDPKKNEKGQKDCVLPSETFAKRRKISVQNKLMKVKDNVKNDTSTEVNDEQRVNVPEDDEEYYVPPKSEDEFETLHTRTTPSAFHRAMARLNDAQKTAVRDMGFGHLIKLGVRGLPAKLAYWVIDKFNSQTCEFEFREGVRIKVTENDVFSVYGFPCGNRKIESFKGTSGSDLYDEWYSSFNVDDKEKIKIRLVLSKMLGFTDGGVWFKRNFIIAMCFSFIESCSNGMVQPFTLEVLEDVSTVNTWNWCEVLRTQ